MRITKGTSGADRMWVHLHIYDKHFFIRDGEASVSGTLIAYAADARGYGAIIHYDNGEKAFWSVDEETLQLVYLGEPPALPKFDFEPQWVHELSLKNTPVIVPASVLVPESVRENSVRADERAVVSISRAATRALTRTVKSFAKASPS